MKILAVSDVELDYIYQPKIADRFFDIDLMISCGDLPHYYLEFMVSMLNVPLYFVNGNHANKIEISSTSEKSGPWGAIDLHRRCLKDDTGVLLAGVEGSIRYNRGSHQYTQGEMWSNVFSLVPKLMLNKLIHGRFLDIFISHAPPWQIHDQEDLPHQGVKAYRWLIKSFKPTYHLHGHIHVYRNDVIKTTRHLSTDVINCYGYKVINLDMAPIIKTK
ncbi:MAG: hypothetical protein CVU39_04845 [Chloroflexi bacterium HGW-Chloroflexi-10]|nr:MAG: hypothetical protein CVU39_04845 [Chloroflexi bacterium HGW-Chloroflexi-10]